MTTERSQPGAKLRPNRARRGGAALAIALTLAAVAAPGSAPRALAVSNPLPVPFYAQFERAWADLQIGYYEDVAMRSRGSLLTAMAMVASAYHLRPLFLVPGSAVTDGAPSPDFIHLYLKESGGYIQGPAKTVIVDYAGLSGAFLDPADQLVGLDFIPESGLSEQKIDRLLAAGEPTILIMQPSPNRFHPVVVVGWDVDGVVGSYLVHDPAARQGPVAIEEVYGLAWPSKVAGALYPSPYRSDQDSPLMPLITFSTKSPVEIAVVDPQGRRAGYDAASGATVIDVPRASYLPQPVWADPTGSLPNLAPGRLLTIRGAAEGRHRFEMIATGDGPFTLHARVYDGGHGRVVDQYLTGAVVAGEVRKYQIEYSATGPSGFTEGDDFAPEAEAGDDRPAVAGTAVAFDGGASFDIDGAIASYEWEFGDGEVGAGLAISHVYDAPGVYTATLTVTDEQGSSGTDTAVISVFGDQLAGGITERASVAAGGIEAVGTVGSFTPSVSADGRFVAFESSAVNLGSGTPHSIFVRDRDADTTESPSEQDCPDGRLPEISPDARFVVYECRVENPVTHTGLGTIVVHDRSTGESERIDVSSAGEPGSCEGGGLCGSSHPAISEDGRFVAFYSDHANLVSDDTNGKPDAFVHDRQTGTTERVSVATSGAQASQGTSTQAARNRLGISADGRFVAFASLSTDLVPGAQFAADRVYVRDRLLQTTELVSLPEAGSAGSTTGGFGPSISADGRIVAFASRSTDLVPGDTNGVEDAFVRDRLAGTTARVNLSGAGAQAVCGGLTNPSECNRDPVVSRDGRFVVFRSRATNLVASDTNNREDVFLRDRVSGTTELVSQSTDGEQGNGNSGEAHFTNDPTAIGVSADGRFVAFSSDATNLAGADGNAIEDVFLRDRQPAGLVADPSGPYLGWAEGAAAPAHVSFDASRSFDPAGRTLTARWDFGDGSPVVEADAGAAVAHAYAEAGTYTVGLVVTDGERTSPAVTTTAEILPSRAAELILQPACGQPGDRVEVVVDGLALASPQGGWNLGREPLPSVLSVHPDGQAEVSIDAPGGTGLEERLVPIEALSMPSALELTMRLRPTIGAAGGPGEYTVRVPDAGGLSAEFVVPCPPLENEPPRAAAGGPYQGHAGAPVTLDGSASSDREGSPLTYEWTFADGTTATGARPSYAFSEPGTYWVLLVVNDGASDSPTSVDTGSYTTVTVEAAQPPSTILDLAASATGQAIGLGWTCVAGATSYEVYRGSAAGGPYTLLQTGHSSSECSFLDGDVAAGTTYYYRVAWVNDAGQESEPSNEASAAVPSDTTCGAVARAATFRSLDCRLSALRAETLAEVVAGQTRDRLLRALDEAQDQLASAQLQCVARRRCRSKALLSRTRSSIDAYARRLRGEEGRSLVHEPLRSELVEATLPLRADVKALRRDLVCPRDASPLEQS